MNTLPLEIIEKIFLYVPTKQIPRNMLYINKQITKMLMSNHFWINKCGYINPKIWCVLREFNEKEVRYILWYTSLIKEEGVMIRDNNSYEIQILEDDNKMFIMGYAGWLIGSNSDKHPLNFRLTFNITNFYESYLVFHSAVSRRRSGKKIHDRIYATCVDQDGNFFLYNQKERQEEVLSEIPCDYYDICDENNDNFTHRSKISNEKFLKSNEYYVCKAWIFIMVNLFL